MLRALRRAVCIDECDGESMLKMMNTRMLPQIDSVRPTKIVMFSLSESGVAEINAHNSTSDKSDSSYYEHMFFPPLPLSSMLTTAALPK